MNLLLPNMGSRGFHDKPYDEGTLLKLKIFELYAQEWIPVFISQPDPPFQELHLFDLFSGPGNDVTGVPGSPLRLLQRLQEYHAAAHAGWAKVRITVHFSDQDSKKIAALAELLAKPEWQIPDVKLDIQVLTFAQALLAHRAILVNPRAAKFLIIDQYGVDEVTDQVFKDLISFPTTDFIFFLSSSTLHRFRDHPAIKIKIEEIDDSYDVHRAAFDWFLNLTPPSAFLGKFSIRKRSNIYGLIFGSKHPLGIHKFLEVAWRNDEIAGEANFDIDRENIEPGEMLLPMNELRPKKLQLFEIDLEAALRAGKLRSESDLIHFCIAAGVTGSHATAVLQKLKTEKIVACDFRVSSVRKLRESRAITLL